MSRPRMLVVDDHVQTRTLLTQIYALKGWEVRCAASATEAVRELDQHPACVIVDLPLGEGDGETVLEAIRIHAPETGTVVVSTISDVERTAAIISRFHPAAILLKPIRLAELDRVCDGIKAAAVGEGVD